MKYSLMSTGTENIVFNRLFDPGTHWDEWVKYPFTPGYTAVAHIAAIGDNVTTLKVGDRVAVRINHQSHGIISAASCHPIPEGIDSRDATWFGLAKIAFMGARAAQYKLGDSVLLVGAGPIGQMSLRWARAAGVESLVVVDSFAQRLTLATSGGATAVLDTQLTDSRNAIIQASNGHLPRIVVDSTGNHAVLTSALSLAADHGRVVLIGDTGQPGKQTLTSDVISRGINICGAHDMHMTAQWNESTISRLFFSMISSGRVSMSGLNTHFFKPEQCAEAYATVNRDRASTMGVLFDWRDES